MSLRCSLLGCDYGEPEVEEEREERGSEVVITVQEYVECVRCGDRNVLSENTEVTSNPDELDTDSLPDDSQPDSTETATTDSTADAVEPHAETAGTGTEVSYSDDSGDDVVFIEDNPAISADVGEDEFDVPTDEDGEPVTDDGEILEDTEPTSDPDRDRGHGEWPESDDVGPPVETEIDASDWPDREGRTAASGASGSGAVDAPVDSTVEEVTDDAIVLENDTGGSGESAAATDARSVTTNPTPSAEAHETPDSEARTDAGAAPRSEPDTGIEWADSAPTPGQSGGAPREDVPTEFYCPRCDYVDAGDRASLRAGDICPECRKGYISERERR